MLRTFKSILRGVSSFFARFDAALDYDPVENLSLRVAKIEAQLAEDIETEFDDEA